MSESGFKEGDLIAGRYRLDQQLGEGGMGEVWAATHTVTRRAVALKFLKESMRTKPGLRQRFLREASTASALRHPNVVEILDVFDFEERAPVMVMELLQGETLGRKLSRDGRLSLEETSALILSVASAVGSAHALGIVHRDIKPENIFLARTDDETRVKVLDFGIAKLTAEHYLEGGRSALITDTGSMLGTPCYMAPEQATGESAVDHRADIWSIGVILYECLSGTRPIEGENLPQVVTRLMSAGIIPLERLTPELPSQVTTLVTRMLSREPSRRPQNLGEVSTVLGHYTVLRAPGFGPPSTLGRAGTGGADNGEGGLRRARIVATKDVDPQGATMLSSPSVGSSVTVDQARVPRRRRIAAIAALCVVPALMAVSAWSLDDRRERVSVPASGRLLAEAAAVAPSPQSASREVGSVGTTGPHATAAPSAAPSSGKPVRRPAVKRAHTRKAGPPLATSAKKVETDEEDLFPGRK